MLLPLVNLYDFCCEEIVTCALICLIVFDNERLYPRTSFQFSKHSLSCSPADKKHS